jgi:hypothetical protein
MDPERFAALLDGRLDQPQRAELVAQLAASEEALAVYADAVAVVGELEPAGRGPGDATHRGAWRRLPAWSWVAIAAALAGVAVTPWLWTRARSGDREDPGRFVSALALSEGQLPRQWYATPWPGMRGAAQPLTPTARAARLGARLVDLDVALRARDTRARDTTVAALTAEITALVEDLPAAGPLATMYRAVAQRTSAGAPPQELEPLVTRARVAATRLAGAELVQLAAWAEAGRFAAAQHNAAFFRARESRSLLARAAALPSLPPPARALAQRLHADLAPAGPPDWNALEPDLTDLLRVLGR